MCVRSPAGANRHDPSIILQTQLGGWWLLTKSALLLIGHGSKQYPDAGKTLLRHASALHEQGHPVASGFLNGTPTITEAFQALRSNPSPRTANPVHVVPFFMEDGYFTQTAIPRALPDAPIDLCPPIGLHAMMPDLLEQQAIRAAVSHGLDPAGTAVLVIGHGSATNPGQPLTLHRHTAALAARKRFVHTAHACLEEPPFVPDVLRAIRSLPVIVIGYFANHGGHVRHDVPTLLDAERQERGPQGHGIYAAGNVTEHPAMPRIILDQAGFHTSAAGD
jgi:sirohydrochlorin cobaltochelatase